MSRGLTFLVALCCLVLLALAAGPAFAGKRVALVIGNSHYKISRLLLRNPANDAEEVGAALKAFDFQVTTLPDLDIDRFDEALQSFKAAAQGAEIALFFYAGHAVQFESINYLIPIDADIKKKEQLKRATVSLEEVKDSLKGVAGVQVMILDACRDDPFADLNMASRGIGATRGLERIQLNGGDSVTLFSTRANEVAADGDDGARNSPFSAVLIDQLKQPGRQELPTLLQRVAARVKENSGGRQSPELTTSLSGSYYFDLVNDRSEWEDVHNTLDPQKLRAFAKKFPNSSYRAQAERTAELLEKEQVKREREEAQRRAQEEAERLKEVCALTRQLLNLRIEGGDEEGLDRLERTSACPALGEDIRSALAAVRAAKQQQALCRALDDDVRLAIQGRDIRALGGLALRPAAQTCPGASAAIASGTVDVRSALARELCSKDQEQLNALLSVTGPDPAARIEHFAAGAGCERVRTAAGEEARRIRAAEAQAKHAAEQASVCSEEARQLDRLAIDGPRDKILALEEKRRCETLEVAHALERFDALVEQRRQQALAACAAIDIAGLGERADEKGLREAMARCPSRVTDGEAALASIDAKRRLAEACRREEGDLGRAVATRRVEQIDALAQHATCPSLDLSGARRAIAMADCDASIALVGRADEPTLAGLAANDRVCPDAKARAKDRLHGYEEARRKDDQACEEAIGAAADVVGLRRLAGDPRCERRKPAVADQIARLEQIERDREARRACDRAEANLATIGPENEAALHALLSDEPLCERVRGAAQLLQHRWAEADTACDTLAAEAVAGQDAKALARLGDDPLCVRRRSIVTAKLDVVRVAERDRIGAAQRKLSQTGCYSGPASGQVDSETGRALADYWNIKHPGEPAPAIIDPSVAAELEAQRDIVCRSAIATAPRASSPEPGAGTASLAPGDESAATGLPANLVPLPAKADAGQATTDIPAARDGSGAGVPGARPVLPANVSPEASPGPPATSTHPSPEPQGAPRPTASPAASTASLTPADESAPTGSPTTPMPPPANAGDQQASIPANGDGSGAGEALPNPALAPKVVPEPSSPSASPNAHPSPEVQKPPRATVPSPKAAHRPEQKKANPRAETLEPKRAKEASRPKEPVEPKRIKREFSPSNQTAEPKRLKPRQPIIVSIPRRIERPPAAAPAEMALKPHIIY